MFRRLIVGLILTQLLLVAELQARPNFTRLPQPTPQGVVGAVMVHTDSVVYVAGGWVPSTGKYSAQILRWDGREWKEAGLLRQPKAYGQAFAVSGGFVYAGGATAQGTSRGVDMYQFYENELPVIEDLPDLPTGLQKMAGARLKNKIYLAGGLSEGSAGRSVLELDLDAPDEGWKLISEFQGPPRAEPVMAVAQSQGRQSLFLWGGYAPGKGDTAPVVSVDGLRLDLTTAQWTSLPAPTNKKGKAVSVGAGIALELDESKIVVAGGYDAEIKMKELQRSHNFRGVERFSLLSHYRSKPVEWYRYNSKLLLYDANRNRWKVLMEDDQLARSGAAAVKYGSDLLLFQGEIKPDSATHEVIRLKLPE